jgi:hypothetical protein
MSRSLLIHQERATHLRLNRPVSVAQPVVSGGWRQLSRTGFQSDLTRVRSEPPPNPPGSTLTVLCGPTLGGAPRAGHRHVNGEPTALLNQVRVFVVVPLPHGRPKGVEMQGLQQRGLLGAEREQDVHADCQ